jgi:ammonium transporter Rh
MMMRRDDVNSHPHNSSNYNSNLLSMIGTLFLWMFWPSFNGALSDGNAQNRCIVNTLLSLTGSCVMVFLITPFFKEGKFHMENILNATLAGGVIIGSSADIIIHPWVAFFIGCFAGILSVVGFEIIGPFLNRTIGLQDTCGVHSLHGMPGLFGGIISAVITGTATASNYGDSYYVLFPMLQNGRSNGQQGCYQLATIAVSLGLAIVSGIITGLIIKLPCFETMSVIFDDKETWIIEDDEEQQNLQKKSMSYNNINSERKTEIEVPNLRMETEPRDKL